MTAPPRTRVLRSAARTALGLGAPLVLFHVLSGFGAGEITALAVGTVPPLLGALHSAVRHRRTDGLSLTVLAVMLLGLLAALISGDPRDVLVRGALLSLPAGVAVLASLRLRRPVTFRATRALLPHRAERMDRMWETDPRLRSAYRAITIMWASVLLAEGGLRVLMAHTLPVAVLPALETALAVVTILVLQLPTHLLLLRAGVWHQLFTPRHAAATPPRRRNAMPTTPVDPSVPTTAPPAVRRGVTVLGAAAAPLAVWSVAGPLAGIGMTVEVAGAPAPVGPVAVAVAALAAGLAGWGLLVVLERTARRARTAWTWTAVAVLAGSLAGPLTGSTSGPAGTAVLVALHLACGAVLIGLLPRRAAR